MNDYLKFLSSELSAWEMADENFSRIKDATVNGEMHVLSGENSPWKLSKLFVNHRRASITARTDAASIAARPCFLCAANRPANQSSIRWHSYEILINPYPLADIHFTIPSLIHEPQSINGHVVDMAELAKELKGMCVFYNGPRCGASAPDHLHFQAVSAEAVPNFFAINIKKDKILTIDSEDTASGEVILYGCEVAPFPFFIIESTDDILLDRMISRVISSLKERQAEGESAEPMMNIAMRHDRLTHRTTTFIIPRSKHRPECYGKKPGQMLVSPATIEMLGTIVCSRREDFEKLTPAIAHSILSEVGMERDEYYHTKQAIKNHRHGAIHWKLPLSLSD